jgi:hypothetical protein
MHAFSTHLKELDEPQTIQKNESLQTREKKRWVRIFS